MPNISISSAVSYVGVFLLISGFFLVLAGLGILDIEKITVMPGKKTWGFGVFLVVVGVIFLAPEIVSALPPFSKQNATVVAVSTLTATSSPIVTSDNLTPTPKSTEVPTPEPTISSSTLGDSVTNNSPYIVNIYYFPRRENDSIGITKLLEEKGYVVNRNKAGPEMKESENLISYIYYKEEEFDAMFHLREILSDNLNEEFNVYRFSEDRPDKYMSVILTHGKSQYIVSLYYFPRRENDSKRISEILEDKGFIVNSYPAGPDIKEAENLQSYIYFKEEDFDAMSYLREILSDNLNEEFIVNFASEDRPDKNMIVILTHGK